MSCGAAAASNRQLYEVMRVDKPRRDEKACVRHPRHEAIREPVTISSCDQEFYFRWSQKSGEQAAPFALVKPQFDQNQLPIGEGNSLSEVNLLRSGVNGLRKSRGRLALPESVT